MHKRIVFIADFFSEHILGGAELNDSELLTILAENGFDVSRMQSHDVTKAFLSKNMEAYYIISNFSHLNEESKEFLQNNLNYLIYEHDHKYLEHRNPARYINFTAPLSKIVNFYFYKNADAVLCQSKFHKKIMEDNLRIKNIINIGGNLWSLEILEYLRELSMREKEEGFSILSSTIPSKNTSGALRYCQEKQEKYSLIKSQDYKHFLSLLAKRQKFIFLPQTPETLSRVVVEARMLGCSVLTNSLVGASSEDWFELKGSELVERMIQKRTEIFSTVKEIISRSVKKEKAPLVSMFTTFHEGKPFLEHFMKNIVKQTIFNDCELIIIDANSQSNEQELIQKYISKHDNIRYRRIEEKLKPGPCINEALMMARGKYVTFSFIDDVKADFCIESLYNLIEQNPDVDLVYGDVIETEKVNDDFEKTSSKELFSHSCLSFSRENMIKCLPGPMPLWKKSIHQKNGFFNNEDHDYSDDWEMWLRSVNNGSIFKKLDRTVGLYYNGGRSRQDMNIEQRKEEAKLFYTYSHLFGENNYKKYNQYFKQFV